MFYMALYLIVAVLGSIGLIIEVDDDLTVKNLIRYTLLFPLCVLTFMYYTLKSCIKLYKK